MRCKVLSMFFVLWIAGTAIADDPSRVLVDFAKPDAVQDWQAVNDGVMGGVSEGRFKRTDDGTLEFSGTLSLENNGGFASVRTRARKLELREEDVLVAKVKGDGREYWLNLYVNRPLVAFSYRAFVQTKKDEWIEVAIPLHQFEATAFGRVVRDAGPVNPAEVNAVGFLLSDKQAGPFKLEIESIRVMRGQE